MDVSTVIWLLAGYGALCLLMLAGSSGPKWHCLKQGTEGGRTFILIGGFGQPVNTWQTFCQALGQNDSAWVLSRRHLENRLWTILPVSLTPLWVQKLVLCRHIANVQEWQRKKITLVAHSAGGLLADAVAKAFPGQIEAVILLNSYPLGQRGAIGTNGQFWRAGGLRTIPTAIAACILFWRGLRPVKSVCNALFASGQLSRAELRAYHAGLVPDSVLQFLAMTFWVKGTGLLRLRQQGHQVPIKVLSSQIDPIFKLEDHEVMAQRLGAEHRLFHPSTPHCWWLNDEEGILAHNRQVLRAAIYGESIPAVEATDRPREGVTVH